MAVFSTVFAAPFFVLALAPRWTSSLPRSGGWLKDVKILVGLFEIAAALKFFSNADLVFGTAIITRKGTLVIWAIIALIAAGYLVRKSLAVRKPAVWLAPVMAICLSLWFVAGARGMPLGEVEAFLPPSDIGIDQSSAAAARLEWILNDQPKALSIAGQTGKLVFIDFPGYTCTNCWWMEANMFSREQVAQSLSHYVLSRLYTDGDGEMYERQQKFQEDTFGTVALPLYAIVDSQGKTVRTFSGLTRSPAEFLAFLRDDS
jgi:thiol:disulfide interchange protein DsbD